MKRYFVESPSLPSFSEAPGSGFPAETRKSKDRRQRGRQLTELPCIVCMVKRTTSPCANSSVSSWPPRAMTCKANPQLSAALRSFASSGSSENQPVPPMSDSSRSKRP